MMAVTWNWVKVVRDEDDFTLGISMTREEAKTILSEWISGHENPNHPAQALFDALFSAAYSDRRKDSSGGSPVAPSLPQTNQQSEHDIVDGQAFPDA